MRTKKRTKRQVSVTGKILTRHPEPGKTGRTIDRRTYETVREAILDVLRSTGGETTHAELFDRLERKLAGRLAGSVSWYSETVKLDLEARKVIKRLPGSPQRIRLLKT